MISGVDNEASFEMVGHIRVLQFNYLNNREKKVFASQASTFGRNMTQNAHSLGVSENDARKVKSKFNPSILYQKSLANTQRQRGRRNLQKFISMSPADSHIARIRNE